MRSLLFTFFVLFSTSTLIAQPSDYAGESAASAEVFFRQGAYYHDEGKLELAVEYYKAALDADGNRTDACYNLALAHYRMNNFGKAELALVKLLEQKPDDLEALELLGLSRFYREDFDRAVATYDAILAKETRENVFVYRASAHSAAGRNQQALLDFDQALRLNPENYPACLGKGNTMLELGQLSLALSWFDRALELKTGDAVTLSNRSIALFRMGDTEAAMQGFNQALQLDNQAFIYLARANCRTESGDGIGALSDIKEALRLAPDNPEVYYALGLLELKNGNCQAAAESFDVALDFKPSNATYFIGRAKANMACRYFYRAIEDLRYILSIDPKHREADVLLHSAYQKLDKNNLEWMTAEKQ
jgi:tetratricopeptide (TPR) repeat protein